MANPSVLTPIGFDTPQLQFSVTPQVAQNLAPDSTPDTTGLNILSEANKSFMQTQQVQSESYKQQADAIGNIGKAQMAAEQGMAQANAVAFQSNAASGQNSLRSWTGLVENIGGQIEKVAKIAEAKRLAELKAQLDQNQITTTTELENLQINWIEGGKITREGTAAYRRAVGEVLASRPLQADTISGLTTKYFQPGLDHAKQQDKLAFDTAQKVAGTNRDIVSKKVQLDLITETAGLSNQAYSSPEQTQAHLESINSKIAAVFARTDIDDLTKAQVVSDAMDPVLKSSNTGVQAKTELGRIQLGASTLANYINTNSSRVVSGDLSQTQFDNDANIIRRSYGLPEKETTNPQKDLDRVMTNMQNNLTLEDLRMKNIINDTKAVEGNKLYVAGLAAQFYLDPALLASQDGVDPKTLDKNALAALKLAKEGTEFFRTDRERLETYKANANEAILKIQKGDYDEAIRLINKSGEDNTTNSLTASLRNLGLGMPNQAPGQVGVTQEQLDQKQAASTQVQQSIIEGVKVKQDAYNRRAQEFATVGIYQDKGESQKFLKQMQPKLKAYNDELAAIKMKAVQQLQVPGQSPNFNGGSLGAQVPLTKRSFRGVAGVAMPFPVGAANAMADAGGKGSGGFFGDSRDGGSRQHAGLDFPVPVGTPLLSMVYGTITQVQRDPGTGASYGNAVEVKGDDGRTYFYAHMDKASVKVGQRVGAGEKIGTSGESGAPGGPHLHMEISVDGKTVDPLQVLSTNSFGQQPKGVRTGGNISVGNENQVQIDPRAIPMGNNSYLLDGKMVKFNPNFSKSQAMGAGVGTPVADMTVIALRTDIQNIKIKAGLEPVGYTALPVTKASPPGTPVGYYTLRNKAGGLLTQTAFLKKGATQMLTTYGVDGKTYEYPKAPRPEEPLPMAAAPSADPSKAGRVLMQKTGQRDAQGLDIISVTLYNKSGGVAGSYTVNSGKPNTQGADTSVAGTFAPAPYGNYDIGAPEAADDISSMRSDFIPITPTFNTQRALLGFHFDGNRATDPGSEGCIVFKNIGEFNSFKGALTSNGVSRLEYVGGKVQIVAPPSTQTQAPRGRTAQVQGNSEAQRLSKYLSNPNVVAFLDGIANAEGLGNQPNGGYDVGFGYRKIASLAEHPFAGSELTPQGDSSASGRFQFMGHTWGDMKRALGLKDFSPEAQQVAALKQIEQAGVLERVAKGDLSAKTLSSIAGIWASVESGEGSGRSVYGGNQVSQGGSYAGFRSYFASRVGKGPQTTLVSNPAQQRPEPSDERIPMGNGKFLLQGKIIGSAAGYTNSSPLQPSYASASKHDYGVGDDTTYNYAQLGREPKLLAALEKEAKRAGVPAQWMADLASLSGTSGIQGPEELAMLADKLQGEKIRTPSDMVRVALGDGEATSQLGIHAGRRYDSQFTRFARATAGVHREQTAGCTLCSRLASQSDFVIHKGELA